MTTNKSSITIAVTFLAGVAAWYGARVWTFGHFRASFVIAFGFATALAVSLVRGDGFSRWLALLISAGGAYASFNLFAYMNSRGIDGGAYLLPGVVFSLCCVALLASRVVGFRRKGQTTD